MLATDDDDGDLSNGTPHECVIRTPSVATACAPRPARSSTRYPRHARGRRSASSRRSPACRRAARATRSRVRRSAGSPADNGLPAVGYADAMVDGPDQLYIAAPAVAAGVVYYKIRILFGDTSQLTLAGQPRRPVLPALSGPHGAAVLHRLRVRSVRGGLDDGDRRRHAVAVGVGRAERRARPIRTRRTRARTRSRRRSTATTRPRQTSYVATPEIDVGQYSDVRLQYRRWLAVEDSHFDQARDPRERHERLGERHQRTTATSSALDHIDKEWRFHDVPVSRYIRGHTLTVKWEPRLRSGPPVRRLDARRRVHRRQPIVDLRRRRSCHRPSSATTGR